MAVRICRAIVHEVPKGKHSPKTELDVTLSTQVTPLQTETRRFIEDNMLNFSLKHPRVIKEDTAAGSTTPGHIRQIFCDPEAHFVSASQQLARRLFRSQNANSPSGILIVALVQIDDRDAVLILKAEHQEGMRLRRADDSDRLDLEHLNELIVGNNSRVYKIALLETIDDLLTGQMVDQQNGVMFADFFLANFLGCKLADNAEVQTKSFMDSALQFFNKDIQDPEKSSQYAGALVAYMHSPSLDFQPSEFADNFLDLDHRDDFLDSIPNSVGNAVIRKDLSLVRGKGAGLRFFGPGFTVVASTQALESGKVDISRDDDTGETTIRLSGDVKRINFGSVPKASML